jgi:hypothetical protein
MVIEDFPADIVELLMVVIFAVGILLKGSVVVNTIGVTIHTLLFKLTTNKRQ